MKTIAKILGACMLFFILAVGGQYFGLWNLKFFGPKYENARREIYESTQSYVEGKRQGLTKYYQEFRNATPEEKVGIRTLMMQDMSNFDIDKLNSTQLQWYNEMVDYILIPNE